MGSKLRNMFYQNKKQGTTEISVWVLSTSPLSLELNPPTLQTIHAVEKHQLPKCWKIMATVFLDQKEFSGLIFRLERKQLTPPGIVRPLAASFYEEGISKLIRRYAKLIDY
ncbi:hypothetical protein AAG570_010660 [Ranatra chinensis]|uniref:Uncharacterized protein n=1 Tax=Ranatra chinensis TaxID=642074 RepID=A0ABD0YN77_9HEMI